MGALTLGGARVCNIINLPMPGTTSNMELLKIPTPCQGPSEFFNMAYTTSSKLVNAECSIPLRNEIVVLTPLRDGVEFRSTPLCNGVELVSTPLQNGVGVSASSA